MTIVVAVFTEFLVKTVHLFQYHLIMNTIHYWNRNNAEHAHSKSEETVIKTVVNT